MLKEVHQPSSFGETQNVRVFGEFSSYKYGNSLRDPEDFEQLSNNRYVNCCIYQDENGQTNYFGNLARHATWVPLLKDEVGATIHDAFDPGQLWLDDDGKISIADFAAGLSRCESAQQEKAKLRKFFDEINPEFLKKPYVKVSFGMINSTVRYKFFPAANRLMRVNRRRASSDSA